MLTDDQRNRIGQYISDIQYILYDMKNRVEDLPIDDETFNKYETSYYHVLNLLKDIEQSL